jgi:putative ABC transport system permease protein
MLASAVLLASALVVAAACGLGSVRYAISAHLTRIVGAADARIIDENGNRFDAELLESVRTWPGVRLAGGRLLSSITVLGVSAGQREGRPPAHGADQGRGEEAPRVNLQVRGIDPESMEAFGQIELVEGALPRHEQQILLDPLSRTLLRAEIGDILLLQRFGEPMRLEVSGFYARPTLGMMQRPEAIAARSTLELASDRPGQVNVISIILEEGMDVLQWCSDTADRLEAPLLLEPAERIRTGFDRQARAGNLGFLLGAVIAFLSCAFIVATGMTTAVVEQERLMGVMRCIGASRRHLFTAQLLAGALLCAGGGLLGVPLGAAIGWVVVRSLREWLPEGLAIEPLGVLLAVGGALAAGLAGSAYPAWRATRVSPLVALSIRSQPPPHGGMLLCGVSGLACISVQLLLIAGLREQVRFWAYAVVGLPLLHIGWFLLSPPLLALLTALVGPALSRSAGLPPGMLVGSLRAAPYRAGFTAGALMVGISILVSTWSNGLSLVQDWLAAIRFPDGLAFRVTGITPAEQERLAALPFVQSFSPVGYLPLRVGGDAALGVQGLAPPNVICVGVDPQSFFGMNALEWRQGAPEVVIPALGRGEGVLVAREFLEARELGVGDTIRIAGGRIEHDFRILGVIGATGLEVAAQWFGVSSAHTEHAMSVVVMDSVTVKRLFGSDEARMVQLSLDPIVADGDVEAAIQDAVPGVLFKSGRELRRTIEQVAAAALATTSGVALGSLLLGCFGVGNVIAAGAHARRHEFGVLRAVGGGRWLPARLVCAEAAMIGIGGAVAGTCLGLHLAWTSVILHRDLIGLVMRVVVPAGPILIGTAVAALLAVLAALPVGWVVARRTPRELLAARE